MKEEVAPPPPTPPWLVGRVRHVLLGRADDRPHLVVPDGGRGAPAPSSCRAGDRLAQELKDGGAACTGGRDPQVAWTLRTPSHPFTCASTSLPLTCESSLVGSHLVSLPA